MENLHYTTASLFYSSWNHEKISCGWRIFFKLCLLFAAACRFCCNRMSETECALSLFSSFCAVKWFQMLLSVLGAFFFFFKTWFLSSFSFFQTLMVRVELVLEVDCCASLKTQRKTPLVRPWSWSQWSASIQINNYPFISAWKTIWDNLSVLSDIWKATVVTWFLLCC